MILFQGHTLAWGALLSHSRAGEDFWSQLNWGSDDVNAVMDFIATDVWGPLEWKFSVVHAEKAFTDLN